MKGSPLIIECGGKVIGLNRHFIDKDCRLGLYNLFNFIKDLEDIKIRGN
jgi:hypothetical protein